MNKFIYLDNIAGTKPDERVIKAMLPYIEEFYGNPSAHFYPLGRKSYTAINEARQEVAKLLNVANAEDIYFTASGTESNNIAIKGVLLNSKKRHAVISEIEHFSVQNPILKLTNEGYTFTKLPVDEKGRVKPEDVRKAITDDTAIVAIAHANSEIGVIQNIDEIGKICKEKGVHFHVDAVASCGQVDIDVEKMNASSLSIAGQNIYAPRGIAALYLHPDVRIKSLMDGGYQERGVRSGSENVAGIVALGEACKIARLEMHDYVKKMKSLRDELIKGLGNMYDFLHFTGDLENRLPNHVSFWIEYIEGESILMWYALKNIYVASGSACSSNILAEDDDELQASHVLTAVGVPTDVCAGSIAMSLSKYTTEEDIKYVLAATPEIVNKLCSMSPAFNRKN